MPSLKHARRKEIFHVRSFFVGPPTRAERPQTRRKPSVEHVFFTVQHDVFAVLRLRFFCGVGVISRHYVSLIRAFTFPLSRTREIFFRIVHVPHWDLMTPPQLSRDAPISDIRQPRLVNFLKTLRDDGEFASLHSLQRGLRHGFHLTEPLLRNNWFDDFATPLRARHAVRIRLRLDC